MNKKSKSAVTLFVFIITFYPGIVMDVFRQGVLGNKSVSTVERTGGNGNADQFPLDKTNRSPG